VGALPPLQKAAALRPESFDANYLLGVILSESGRKLEALRRLRTARQIRPSHPGVLSLLGVVYLEQGYPLDAIDTLDEARRLDPSRLPVWLALVQAGHEAFEFEKALQWASEAAARFPDSADACFRLGFELEAAGRFEDSRAAFERALKLKPDHPETRLAMGRMEARAGQRTSAIGHFETVLRLQPGNDLARLELAKSLVGGREFARAKPLLLALGEDAADPTPHLLLSQVYQAEGNAEESARQRARYLELTAARNTGGMSGNLASRKLRRFVP
jgi:predicted Zn-dependent protease